jgi:hypothetical protein
MFTASSPDTQLRRLRVLATVFKPCLPRTQERPSRISRPSPLAHLPATSCQVAANADALALARLRKRGNMVGA